MHYYSVKEARHLPGLRLVLTAGVPGPWGQAAKALLGYRQVSYIPVAQAAMEENAELVAWTGRRDAPQAILNDEVPCENWLEILMLAERLGSGPSLLPANSIERALCLGFSTEICGPWGLGWCRRISMWSLGGPARTPAAAALRRTYGYSPASSALVPARLRRIIQALGEQLERQAERGSEYLIEQQPTACDFYWAVFSIMFDLPAHLKGRIPVYQQAMYATVEPLLTDLLTPALLRHRDMIFVRHIGLPIEF